MSRHKIEVEIPDGEICNPEDGNCLFWIWQSLWCVYFRHPTRPVKVEKACKRCPACIQKYGIKEAKR